jgi:dTDP-4-dehydrorhamnose reductase
MKIFLTGATGLLGSNILSSIRDSHHIVANYRSRKVSPHKNNLTTENIDLTNKENLKKALIENDCNLVLNTAGYTDVNGCEKFPKRAFNENVLIAENLANVTNELNIDYIHISSDHLFSGKDKFIAEKEKTFPLNEYAKSKVQAEEKVMSINSNALIVRTNFYGWGPEHRNSFSDWILSSLRTKTSITMYTNLFYTPINVLTLIDTIFELYEKKATGIFNVVGEERVSKYDFGMQLAKIFKLDIDLISPAEYSCEKNNIKRPIDMSLSNKKLTEYLGHPIEKTEEGIRKLKESESHKDIIDSLF